MLKVNNVKVPLDNGGNFDKYIAQKLGLKPQDILSYGIIRQAVDARDKHSICFVMNFWITIRNNILLKNKDVEDYQLPLPLEVKKAKPHKTFIVGAGPAGLFAGLTLAKAGFNPIILERGKMVDERTKDVKILMDNGILNLESNILFGEGGAGTFSDGKLTTSIKSDKIRYVLDEFIKAGAPKEIGYLAHPHIGTDVLSKCVKSIREEIISLGGSFRFETKLCDLIIEDNALKKVLYQHDGKVIKEDAEFLILAIGHSARDTFSMLNEKGLKMAPKPFSMGVRIEQKQSIINAAQYGEFAKNPYLGNADYKLACHLPSGRSVYTFCMCPGGVVVPAMSEEKMINVNGMSYHSRDGENANSALLVNVEPSDFSSLNPLSGIEFQRKYERLAYSLTKSYQAPAMRVGDFLKTGSSTGVNPSYKPGVVFTDIKRCLPDFVSNSLREALPIFNRKIHNFASDDAVLTAVETRSSSPVRILRELNFSSSVKNIFPIGEGAGYAGGITSAAVDGINVALNLIERDVN